LFREETAGGRIVVFRRRRPALSACSGRRRLASGSLRADSELASDLRRPARSWRRPPATEEAAGISACFFFSVMIASVVRAEGVRQFVFR
jgi:hypothetical protein